MGVTWHRNAFVDDAKATVSVRAKAFNYGLGCFGGIRAYWDEVQGELFVFRLRDHVERLVESARIRQRDSGACEADRRLPELRARARRGEAQRLRLLCAVDRRLEPGGPRVAWLVATAILLFLLSNVRTSNVLFASIVGVGWAVLAGTRVGREEAFPWAAAGVAAALVILLQQAAIAGGRTNAGMVLGEFVSVACGRMPAECAADPEIPGPVADADLWSEKTAGQMQAAWRRLIVHHPILFARGVAATWKEQLVAEPPWAILLAAGGIAASVACATAPLALLLGPFAVQRARGDPRRQALLVALGAWVLAEVVATTAFFANAWNPDASRMRLHWELQAALLWVVLADGWLRGRRVSPGAVGATGD